MRTAARVSHPLSRAIPTGVGGVTRALAAALVIGVMVTAPAPARAQAPVPQLLASAKQYLLDLKSDSAGLVLQTVLESGSGASAAERAWAFSLMALVRLEATDRSGDRKSVV
jgi:hypothetical protein